MRHLSRKGQQWLKGLHVFVSCVWVGCATALAVTQHFVEPENGGELYGIIAVLDFIDLFILVPGAIGVLLTSLVYSIWTKWGWFKHTWIVVKWAICVYGIVFGTFWLGPWLSDNAHIAKELGMAALSDSQFLNNRHNSMIFGAFQACTLIFAVFISILKPWKKNRSDRQRASAKE